MINLPPIVVIIIIWLVLEINHIIEHIQILQKILCLYGPIVTETVWLTKLSITVQNFKQNNVNVNRAFGDLVIRISLHFIAEETEGEMGSTLLQVKRQSQNPTSDISLLLPLLYTASFSAITFGLQVLRYLLSTSCVPYFESEMLDDFLRVTLSTCQC